MDYLKRLEKFMNSLNYYHNPEIAKEIGQINAHYTIDTPAGTFEGTMIITEEKSIFMKEPKGEHDFKIKTDLYSFFDYILGLKSIEEIKQEGKISIEGDIEKAKILPKIFTRNYDESNIKYFNETVYPHETNYLEKWEPPNKVLVFNGSPRKREGFTWEFLEPLLDGMKDEGAEIEVIDVYDEKLKIESCYSCFVCQAVTFGKCIIRDDAEKLIKKMGEAELVVFATPIHSYSVPSKLKALIDRTFSELQPFFIPHGDHTRHPLWRPAKRYFALFAVSGYPEPDVFKPLELMFEGMARDAHAPLLAKIFRPGAWLYKLGFPFARYYQIIKENIFIAGRELIRKGRVSEKVLENISRQYIPKELYYRFNNAYWLNRLIKVENRTKATKE